MEDRSVEVHPCGTPTLDIPQELGTLYYTEFIYCVSSMSSFGLQSICVWWYGRYRLGAIQESETCPCQAHMVGSLHYLLGCIFVFI